MADLVEKEGRDILDSYHETDDPLDGTQEDQPNRVLSRVLLQNEGLERVYLSFQLYVELREAIALFFEDDSIEWLWVTNRLAGVSALLGLREEAKEMYSVVIQGRRKHLGENDKATEASMKYWANLSL